MKVRAKPKPQEQQQLDARFRKTHQKCPHQSGDGSRGAQDRNDAAGKNSRMHQQRHRSGQQIEQGVDQPPPSVLKHAARKPQKPHIEDQVQPSAVEEARSDVTREWMLIGDEGVALEDRIALQICKLLRQCLHLRIDLRGVPVAHLEVPEVLGPAVGRGHAREKLWIAALNSCDQLLHIGRGLHVRVGSSEQQNVQLHIGELVRFVLEPPVRAEEHHQVQGDDDNADVGPAPALQAFVREGNQHNHTPPRTLRRMACN